MCLYLMVAWVGEGHAFVAVDCRDWIREVRFVPQEVRFVQRVLFC